MTYLIVCDHERLIVDKPSVALARAQFRCKRCVKFDLTKEQWTFKDVRLYVATEQDVKAGSRTMPKTSRPAKINLDQTDWVEMKL